MVVRIHKPEQGYGSNTGSCKDLVDYLGKENEGKSLSDQEFFFNHISERISERQVISMIDKNKMGLRAKDPKFFMLTINPSEKELLHIGNDKEALMRYTQQVMDEYAKGFNRKIDERDLSGKDLRWFAKIEHNRTYSFDDHKFTEIYSHNKDIELKISNLNFEIKTASVTKAEKIICEIDKLDQQKIRNEKGLVIKPGVEKDGLNTHIHIIVSRKDEQGKMSLSPFANARKAQNTLNDKKVPIGFDRDDFTKRCETQFDLTFDYVRGINETIKPFRLPDITQLSPQAIIYKSAYRLLSSMVDDNKIVMNGLNKINHISNPKNFIIKEVSNKLAQGIAAGALPVAIPAKLIERTMQQTINHIIRAAEISL